MPVSTASNPSVDSWPLGPFLEGMRAEPVSSEHGRATWRLIVAEQHLRTHGILHGGVVATLLDTANIAVIRQRQRISANAAAKIPNRSVETLSFVSCDWL